MNAQELNIKSDNKFLQKVQHTKLLGIVIDENLSFNKHIEHLIKKISSKIAVLHRLRYRLAVSLRNQIYLAIVQFNFDYCFTVWGNTSKQNLKTIQCLQNRAEHAVTGIFDYKCSVSKIINDLSWININQGFSYFLGILVYKCLNNFAPEYLSSLLTYVSDTQLYPTRTAINKYLALP